MSICSEWWLIITHQIPRKKFQKRIKNRNPCKNRNSLDYEIQNTQRFRSCDNHIPYRCLFSRKRTIINFAKLTPPVPIPNKVRKIIKILIFISLWGSSKVFMKVSNAFIEPFWGTSKRSEIIKFTLIFILIQISEMHLEGRVSKHI